jgi:phospholipid-binding lipoprotein MlaA
MQKILSIFATVLLLGSLSACATAPTDPADRAEFEASNDPLEPANRVVFEFNQIVDKVLLRPAAYVYREVMPDFAQDIVHNVLENANEPIVFMNAMLQGRVEDAGKSFNRFLVNTVAGVGGMIDLASEGDLKKVDADFGQTLHVWGMPEGPYLVLPILGPSNPRDATGFAVDTIASPWGYVAEDWGGKGTRNRYIIASLSATMLDKRSKAIDALDALEKGSVDFYAQLRSVSRQYRNKQLGIKSTAKSIHKMNADGSVE